MNWIELNWIELNWCPVFADAPLDSIFESLGISGETKGKIGKKASKCPYCDRFFKRNGADLQPRPTMSCTCQPHLHLVPGQKACFQPTHNERQPSHPQFSQQQGFRQLLLCFKWRQGLSITCSVSHCEMYDNFFLSVEADYKLAEVKCPGNEKINSHLTPDIHKN